MRRAWCVTIFVPLAVVVACGDESGGEGGAGANAGEAGDASSSGGSAGEAGGKAGRGGASGAGGDSASAGTDGETTAGAGAGTSDAGAAGEGGEGPVAGSFLPSYASGTRLLVKELASPDMPSLFVTFHDSELDVDCAFTTVTDGSLRCLPVTSSATPIIWTQMFLDADCTVPVAIGDPACVPAGPGFLPEIVAGGTCATTSRVLRTTPLEDGVELFGTLSGDCAPSGTTNQTYHYFSVSEADPDIFVQGAHRILPATTRLSVERLEAEDGAYLTLGIADPETERECRVFERDDALMCVPAPSFSGRGYRYADESCETPVTLPQCSEPLFVLDLEESGEGYRYRHAGPEHTGDVYGGVSMCEAVTGEGPFYSMGELADVDDFPAVTATYEGERRLRQLVYRDSVGTALAAGSASGVRIMNAAGLFDTEFDAPCSLSRGPDHELYCIPEGVPYESSFNLYYADPDCTEQLSVCGTHGCPADLAVLLGGGEGAVCGRAPGFVNILTLGEPVEPDELYIFYSGREPGMECDGPFSAADYGILRRVTGDTDDNPFARAPLAP